ncbi:Cupredoxin [Aspergillus cavernicola]|uniref:Cupredoxin n=1 Tax=Aspergillus cavernicola TaxID=176166 RepID=A0ABR4I8K5_9EURO
MRAIYRFSSLLALLCLAHWVSCKVVRFELDLTYEDREIAGFVRKAILSNGQLPGPTLRVKQGDDVEFVVSNLMPFATTVHFHGVMQQGTSWSDGTPGLSQQPIDSGDTFVYRWTAVDYGSSVKKPFKLITEDAAKLAAMIKAEVNTKPLMLSDWRFLTSEVIWQAEIDSGCESICSNAILFNGRGSAWYLPQERIHSLTMPGQRFALGNHTLTDTGCFPPLDSFFGPFPRDPSVLPTGFDEGCIPSHGPTEIIEVNPYSRYISRDVISMTGSATLVFSIDEHPMYVYAIDGRYVEPILVEAVIVPAGSRYSVLVELKQDGFAGKYTIGAANIGLNQIINGTAVLSYTARETKNALLFRISRKLPSQTVNQTFILNIDHDHASYRWKLGDSSFPVDYEGLQPALFNTSSIPFPHRVSTYNNTWVDIIFNLTEGRQPPHPMHKQSNKYFVIGYGNQPFTYSSVAEAMEVVPENFNFEHPQLRDTFSTPVAAGPLGTWLAIRYFVINPGPFLLHCHLQMHQSGGMALAVMDGVDAWPVVPEEYQLPVGPSPANTSPEQ